MGGSVVRLGVAAPTAANETALVGDTCDVIQGLTCHGDDLKNYGKVSTYDECCEACKQLSECRAWTLDSKSGKCQLKKQCSNPGQMQHHLSGISTPPSPTPPSPPSPPPPGPMNVLQWSPHWECFQKSHTCKSKVEDLLTNYLTKYDVDFANIVELEDSHYKAPASWKRITKKCGFSTRADYTTLFYNKDRWNPVEGTLRTGCMDTNNRAFIVQQFEGIDNGEQAIVIGAHFPHGIKNSHLQDAISSVMQSTGICSVILIADTNYDTRYSSAHLMGKLKIPNARISRSTDLLHSCCLNSHFKLKGYDRIVTNTPGTAVSTTMLFDWVPSWVQGEFHKPILGTFSYNGQRCSGTAEAAATWTINASRAPTNSASATPLMV